MNTQFASIAALLGVLLIGAIAQAETPTPERLLEDSIAYHDPNGVWNEGAIVLSIHTEYSPAFAAKRGRSESTVEILLDPAGDDFRYSLNAGDDVIEYAIASGVGRVVLNGSDTISDEDRERLRISTPESYRDYCEYVYGLPMKLRDPGTRLGEVVESAQFDGREVWRLRVTYDPEVGSDIWYFYFDPDSAALIGSQFFHDELARDGEYIVYEAEVEDSATGLRLPQSRSWYYNFDDGHLATDTVLSLHRLE
ncbi:hypothetical protein DRQ53_06450 [bacterium]|nr:MAG: hypothetical protein DRQ32_06980 [bacterium]RKZ16413.1 MAG: hypothetical protein DRQ53_06450 [bacterium]